MIPAGWTARSHYDSARVANLERAFTRQRQSMRTVNVINSLRL